MATKVMFRQQILLSVILLMMFPRVAPAQQDPAFVPLSALLARPCDWNGKRVTTIGYYYVDPALHATSLMERASAPEKSGATQIYVNLPASIKLPAIRAAAKHRVRIVGTFQYRKVGSGRIIPPDVPGGREGVIMNLGFGWGGVFDMQITKITRFEISGAQR